MVPVPIDVSRCVGVMDKLGDADWLGGGVARVAMWCSRDGAAMGIMRIMQHANMQ
ncbi:chlorogenic acid esterase precursor [Aspergillus luchuensis]|uniref:Chlorogenic acid esterase n=1 Tax=Aspergillus kawachii TaxID=1069201 RepID=A0A146FGB6_ASPKA|nr:chlorogenic acid esterase precursor [Aspergillus luchuensis]